MALTQEQQEVFDAVIASLRTNSKTIEQMTPQTSLGSADWFELNGGRKVSYDVLSNLINSLSSSDRDSFETLINKNVLKSVSFDVSESFATLAIQSNGKTITCSVPVATSLKAGMLAASDKRELSATSASIVDIYKKISEREDTDRKLGEDVLALQQAVWPLDVKLSVSPDVIEVGKSTKVTASWTARRDGVDILPQSELSFNDGSSTTNPTRGTSSKSLIIESAASATVTCRLTVSYLQMTREATAQIRAVHPSYFGKIAADAAVNAAVVTALTKVLNASRSMTQSGISLANQRICFAYPKNFGTLTSVKDGNNFETLTAYTRTEVTISGVAYYVYTMTEPVTASGVTQIYS